MAKWFEVKKPVCDCDADVTRISAVRRVVRGDVIDGKVVWTEKASQVVRHYRERDEAHFLHWKDQKVVKI